MPRRTRKNGRSGRARNRDTSGGSNLEPAAGNEPLATHGIATFDSQVSLRIDTYRTRLADADGISAKAIIDGLVHCGILRGDTLKDIKEPVEIYQHKVKNQEEERTEVRITKVK